ncbi:MAG TPA: hypothetical protein PKL14_09160 [Holophaga sp.]|nr:hypothetical protein [Holophaga sp.]
MEPEPATRPETIKLNDALQPQGPWTFLIEAIPGGFSRWGIQLMLAWGAFQVLTSAAWALHLRKLAGHSALPDFLGELLTIGDVWELANNSGLKYQPLGFWAPLFALVSLGWVLWAGWRVQGQSIGIKGTFHAWIWGMADALVIGLVPVLVIDFCVSWLLGTLASTGVQGLGWLNLVGGAILRLSCASAFMLQWWLCRIDRATGDHAWHLGGIARLGRHLKSSFLRLWLHPNQWGLLVVGGVLVRAGVHLLVLLLAWHMGGGTSLRVWTFLLLDLAATLLCAWLLGWFLRISALYSRHDALVQKEIQKLEAAAEGLEE